jgi:hypothetical protein
MRRIALFSLAATLALGASLAAYRPFSPEAAPSLARYAPSGALLYLETRDFQSLLSSWNSSNEKRQWVASANYEMFSRSRLFSRLAAAGDQFAAAAGLPPDMNFVGQAAGRQSAVALYDIGNLEFLYISKLPAAEAMRSALWQSRASFETREAAGTQFYFRRDAQSEREVAFAVKDGFLVLATREHLMAGALSLLAGAKEQTVEAEPWFVESTSGAGPAGDLRLVLNLEKLVPSPYFRSYWIQHNVAEIEGYSAAVSDLFLSARNYREERVLVKRAGAAEPEEAAAAVADLSGLVPGEAGYFRLRARPPLDRVLDLVETKLLAPNRGPGVASRIAPQVALGSPETGDAADLETRIDAAPVSHLASDADAPLKKVLESNPVLASLEVEASESDKDGVFVRIHTAVALLGSSAWGEETVRSALVRFLEPALTTGRLGVSWQAGSGGVRQLDGLLPLFTAVRGNYLIVSDDASLMAAVFSRLTQKTDAKPATFIAGFNHARERERFARLTGQLDAVLAGSPAGGDANGTAPAFLSGNIASLSSALSGVSSARVVVSDAGDKVRQTVTYEWTR